MTEFPDLKFRALVSFPAGVYGGTGVAVRKENGNYYFDIDFSDFAPPVTNLPDPENHSALMWNAATGVYKLVPIDAVLPTNFPSDANPLMDGVAAPGALTTYARGDHVHPTDTSRAPLDSPIFTSNPRAPTPAAGDNDTSIATTAFVQAASFPSGTVMLFYQAAAPTGWTKLTTQNDKALRVVSGSGGVAGGTNAFSTVMAQTVTGNTALVASQVPNLSVSVSGTVTVYPAGNAGYNAPIANTAWGYVGAGSDAGLGVVSPYVGGAASQTYTNAWSAANSMAGGTTTGGGGNHSHPITMAIQYIDVILASKN